jgi:hypothetical protein
VVFVTLTSSLASAQPADAGCDLGWGGGQSREKVKNRKPSDGANYTKHGSQAQPLSIADWFNVTCKLNQDPSLPLIVPDSKETVMPGIETNTVTVDGYIVALKWDNDNDLHIQISPQAKFIDGQILVEIPAMQEYCDARTTVWDLIHQDEKKGGNKVAKGKGRIMKTPVHVVVTGFVFFDGHHGDTKNGCTKPHISGIHGPGRTTSPIQGLWEIHPVTKLVVAP